MFDLNQVLMAAAHVGDPVTLGAAVIRDSHVEMMALLLAGAVLVQLCYELRRLYIRFNTKAPNVASRGDDTESRPASDQRGAREVF